MTTQLVEAVWVWRYGTTAQKATYGRFGEGKDTGGFSKDYLQVSGEHGDLMETLLPPGPGNQHRLLLHSPGGIAESGFVSHSVDRAHLAWETNRPPAAWRMTKKPSPGGPATIPGYPDRTNFTDALRELALFDAKNIKAYLVAVKLAGEGANLHLRAYLEDEPADLRFADISHLPAPVAALFAGFTANRGCVSGHFTRADSLYFDADRNHAAWSDSPPPVRLAPAGDDAVAEQLDVDPAEVAALEAQAAAGDFSAPDGTAVTKTRGSGQKVFADAVKANYGYRCALTGISTADFLVASHIVPWAEDKEIRLDPSNGICLSTLVDRAFDTGYLQIDADCVGHVDWVKVGKDDELRVALKPVDGKKLTMPQAAPPKGEYLRRRLQGLKDPKP